MNWDFVEAVQITADRERWTTCRGCHSAVNRHYSTIDDDDDDDDGDDGDE